MSSLCNHAKRWKDVYEAVGVVLAIGLSICSLIYSREANRQARTQARPYITLDVVGQGNDYLKAERAGTNTFLSCQFRMKNLGQTPAVNIQFADYIITGRDANGAPIKTPFPEKPGVLALAAGEEQLGTWGLSIPSALNDPDIIAKVNAGTMSMEIQVVAEYEDVLSPGRKYYTGLWCEVRSYTRLLKKTSIS